MRKSISPLHFVSAIILSIGASNAHASAFQLIEQNASGLGNGYAGSAAIADNASTIFFNPAGMTRLPGVSISAGATAISTSFKFSNNGSTGPGGLPLGSNTGGDAGSLGVIPNAYISWQLNPDWFVGLGVNAPFGLATSYNKSWIGRYQSTSFSIETINVNPSIAYKVNDRLSLGAGVNWQHLDADYRRNLPAAGLIAQLPNGLPPNLFQQYAGQLAASPDMNARAELKGDAWGWNLGLLYQVTDDTRIGVAYRSKMKYNLSGTTTLSTIPGLFAGKLPGKVDNSADVTLPDTAIFSIVHDLNSKWQLLGDVSWTGWSSIPSLDINNGALGEDSLKLKFRDTWRVALGVNYQFNQRWQFKTGIAYDQTPIPNSSLRPTSLPDSDRIIASIGAQYRFNERTTIDVGYAHLFFHSSINNSTDPKKGTVSGDLQTSADMLGVQMSYRF
ncbi:OmpP1/FadL family transporter [Paralcaligenes ginsengisoli]